MEKPFSPSCDRNRDPILDVLREHFADRTHVLEIGSGTGQHAVHFAAAMPWLTWQGSDRADNLPAIRMWLEEAALPNAPDPIELDVLAFASRSAPLLPSFDAVFSANTLHIMGWTEVQACFAGIGKVLAADGTVVVYGPFNEAGRFTSDSNRAFDASLRSRDPRMGLRDVEQVDALARSIGLRLDADLAMPANNRCLVWRREAGAHDLAGHAACHPQA